MKLRLTMGLLATQVSAGDLLATQKDKLSYSFGQQFGKNIDKYVKQLKADLNQEMLIKGIQDALSGEKSLLTEQEMGQAFMIFQRQRLRQLANKNLKKGDAFLAENAKKPGVVTLPSGLQYKIIKPGTGKTPTLTDEVTTHYRGTLLNGTEFDSSYKRHKPATFPVKGVIAGWTEALQLMKEGAKWQLFIPSKLAYGLQGAPGGKIGPGATLIFDIELISVGHKKN